MNKALYIVISGNIGAGKTTLCKGLARFFGYRPFFEPARSNPFLKDYYEDMKRWALYSQTFFAVEFARVHREIAEVEGAVCQDRSLFECYVFADSLRRLGVLPEREYSLLRSLIDQLIYAMERRRPDVVVYLYAPLSVLLTRVQERGDKREQAVTLEYLQHLQEAYEGWIAQVTDIPVVAVDSDHIDFRYREGITAVLKMIFSHLEREEV